MTNFINKVSLEGSKERVQGKQRRVTKLLATKPPDAVCRNGGMLSLSTYIGK